MDDDNERRYAGNGKHAIRAQALADSGDGRHRPAHDRPRPHDRERRAAVRAAVAALRHRGPAVGGDRVRAGVRQPAAARRAAGRPARPQGHLHGRPGRLRLRVRRGRGVHQPRHAGDGPGLPGRLRGGHGAVRAVDPDQHVRRSEGPRQGVRRVRRDRRRRRLGGPAAGRRADRVPVLAVDAVRQPVLRRGRAGRRGRAAQAGAEPTRPAAGPARRRAGRRGDVLPGLRVRQRRHARLGHAVDLGFLAAAVAGLAAFAGWRARSSRCFRRG